MTVLKGLRDVTVVKGLKRRDGTEGVNTISISKYDSENMEG